MKEEVQELKQEVKEIKEQSAAMEILTLAKHQNEQLEDNNKRIFIIWIITFIGLLLAVGYIVFLLNDISNVETDTIDIQDVETIDNSHIKIGDDIWEKSE